MRKVTYVGSSRNSLLIGVAMLLLATLVFGIFYLTYKKVDKEGFIEVKGRVVDYNTKYDRENGYMDAIIVEYVVDGVPYIIESDSYSNYPKYIGEVVKIKYNPSNPHDAVFADVEENGLLIAGVVGGVFVIAGVALVVGGIKDLVKGKDK